MSLTKSTGNMYPWVTHCHSFLRGECPHKCSYCYAKDPIRGHASRQVGPLRLDDGDLIDARYPLNSVVFVEHKNDLWAKEVPDSWIGNALAHAWVDGTRRCQARVYQTKNPARYLQWIPEFQLKDALGTTIETNRDLSHVSNAPSALERAEAMQMLPRHLVRFVTIEPILAFDLWPFLTMLKRIRPTFVNIGADSKGHHLDEPCGEVIQDLINGLRAAGIEVRTKKNLVRLLNPKGGAA